MFAPLKFVVTTSTQKSHRQWKSNHPGQSRAASCRRINAGAIHGTVLLLIASLLLGTAVVLHARSQTLEFHDRRVAGGSVMVAGGGAVTPEIRRAFIELAGGRRARIVLIPGTDPDDRGKERLLAPWQSAGVNSIVILNAATRDAANDPKFCNPLAEATGVWFGGGYQSLLADRYVDTLVQQCLHDVLNRNGVVGGCSAGAALLSRVMIREGDTTPIESRGVDVLTQAVIDQHFLARNRLWRLEQILEAHPDLIGLGVDESTALVIHQRTWNMSVIGESYVFVCLPTSSSAPRRIEILKTGDDVALDRLLERHLAYVWPDQ